ncbi:hypothetical protein IWQ62_005363, partial [Dispira parvispora]
MSSPRTVPFSARQGEQNPLDTFRVYNYYPLAEAGYSEYETLPLLKPAVPQEGYHRVVRPLSITPEQCCSINDGFGEINLDTLVHAAWSWVLAHYRDTEEVVVGALFADSGEENQRGIHSSKVTYSSAVLYNCPPEQPVSEWVADVQCHLNYARTRFNDVSDSAQPDYADNPTTPLFDSLVTISSTPALEQDPQIVDRAPLILSGLGCSFLLTTNRFTENTELVLVYNQGIVDHQAAHQLLLQTDTVLQQIVVHLQNSSPQPGHEHCVGDLEWLNDHQRDQILFQFNHCTRSDIVAEGNDDSIALAHEQVFQWSDVHPGNLAVVHQRDQVTYHVLHQRATTLAFRLHQDHHVQPKARVMIFMDKCVHMVTGMLGVLLTGAAFVPVDIQFPLDRVRYILEDSQCHVVVTTHQGAALLEGIYHGPLVVIGEGQGEECTPAAEPMLPRASPDDLAYMIYTSGTTGKPKGVLLEHRGLAHIVKIPQRAESITPGVRVFQSFAVAFDAFLYETLVTLANGGTLVLPGEDPLADLHGVHILTATPSFLAMVEPDLYPDIRLIVSVGEACPQRLRRQWGERCIFANGYGPTECTVFTHFGIMEVDRHVTIGHPLPGLTSYVVDEQLRLLPVGVVGELLIGGVGVAR